MNKKELIFIPSPGMGHLLSTIEFASLLLDRDHGQFSITILVIKPFLGDTHTQSLAIEATRAPTHIRFINLPELQPPPRDLLLKSVENYISSHIESHKDCAKEAILKHVEPNSVPIVGLVLDLFCTSMIDVGNDLGVPCYIYNTSSAASLGFMLYVPVRHESVGSEFSDSSPESWVPSYIHPVPTRVLPSMVFNKDGGYMSFLKHATRLKESKGILTNTFLELESHAIRSLSGEFYHEIPPIYSVGPVINHKGQSNHPQENDAQHDKIMKWLDGQPTSSVVFLCFGSLGSFDEAQLKEIAFGLEKSGHRFLLSVRIDSSKNKIMGNRNIGPNSNVLPEGFVDRTRDRGFLCGWAPQVEVLAHRAVGGFVSHCGWNSILESIWYGVPILTWPMYAEQQMNAFMLVRDLGLAVELRLDYRSGRGIVKGDEIEKALKHVMDKDSEVRKRVKDMSEKSRKALERGGSSDTSMRNFIGVMLGNACSI